MGKLITDIHDRLEQQPVLSPSQFASLMINRERLLFKAQESGRTKNGIIVPNFPPKPLISPRGDITVVRPLDLIKEIEDFLREERLKIQAKELGVPYLAGGAASAWAFTNGGRTSLLNGTFDIDSDTYKMALFLSSSDLGATETTFAGVTNEHAANNGYTAGGIAVTLTLSGTTTVTVDISSDPVWTASGGPITARFAAIYEVGGNILVYCTLDNTPADVTATDGNTLTVAAHASGVFTLA